jgi:hypothetical protein
MSDQCKHCVKRGKYEECIKNECDQMETWIIQHLLLLVDIEHRRRVAAEELYELHTEYYLKINDYDDEQLSDMECKISKAFKKWQSIIKEAGE